MIIEVLMPLFAILGILEIIFLVLLFQIKRELDKVHEYSDAKSEYIHYLHSGWSDHNKKFVMFLVYLYKEHPETYDIVESAKKGLEEDLEKQEEQSKFFHEKFHKLLH